MSEDSADSNEFFDALKGAVKSPATWVPLVATLPFLIEDGDRRFANRMRERQSLYEGRALDASDDLRSALKYGIWAAALLPNDCKEEFMCAKKWERLGFTGLSVLVHNQAVGSLKSNIRRDRPFVALVPPDQRRGGDDSMPSFHSADAFFGASMSVHHIGDTNWNKYVKAGVQTALWGSAAAVALARVEGGVHYPTDVLVGAALGNFFATFFYELFIARNPSQRENLQVGVTPEGLSLQYHF